MKFFISHKREDSSIAIRIADELAVKGVPYYLDVLDVSTVASGKELTEHIKQNLNDCTDIIVIMSSATRFSQWVPFEVGMSAQNDMPTATFLQDSVVLPEFLEYWPRLKKPGDINAYIAARNDAEKEYLPEYARNNAVLTRQFRTRKFYEILKRRL